MSAVSVTDAYNALLKAGLSPAAATIGVAIGMAESSLRTDAIGDVNVPMAGCESIGVWQINSCPSRDGGTIRADRAALLTLDGNARAAAQISGMGKSWRPWTTYTSGAYAKHLAEVAAGLAHPGSPAPDSGASSTETAGLTVSNASWASAGKSILLESLFVAGGVALVGAGLWRAVRKETP